MDARTVRSDRRAAKLARFVEVLAETGSITASCQAAEIGRAWVYELRNRDAAFADAWDAALDLGIARLEDRALGLAMEGNDRLIMFLLSSRMPERYGQRSTIDLHTNVSIGLNRIPIEQLRAQLASLLAIQTPLTIEAPSDLTPLGRC